MRELKFRAWDKSHDQMEYINDLYWFEESGVHDSEGDGHHANYTLMQYTGLNDKNGVTIYEGDVIKDAGNIRGEVYWNKENASFYVKLIVPDVQESMKYFMNLHYPTLDTPLVNALKNFYVFGNIYENPDWDF
jgi:uncharacterized phage protein (TIGR01671 family)